MHSIQYTVYEGQVHNSLSIFFYWDLFEEMTSQQKPPLHILLGVSGSVAAIKLPQLVFELHNAFKTFGKTGFNVQIRVIVTKRGLYFLEKAEYYEGSMGLYEHFKNIEFAMHIAYPCCILQKIQKGKDKNSKILSQI